MDAIDAAEELAGFIDRGPARNTLALMYGRRRIGKSTTLSSLTRERNGFYWEATRAETPIQLQRLGAALGERQGVGALALSSWEDALERLLQLGAGETIPVVLDEFGYLLESEHGLDSVVATLLGPAQRQSVGRTRLILCGSAIAMMRSLTAGQAPLRGRAARELLVQPYDFRRAGALLGEGRDRALATRLFAVIGGVVGYATDMVDDDLPQTLDDFPRWIAQRVLSPAATLHHEATTLLAEDPMLSAGDQTLHHSILNVIANGDVTLASIAKKLGRPASNLDPVVRRLVDAGFVARHDDPVRLRRPTFALADPFLQFHYAVLEPHRTVLRDRNVRSVWESRLTATFDSRVRGPVFEEQARTWVRRFAASATLGGEATHIGPSLVTIERKEFQLDVVVCGDDPGAAPADRPVLSVGEAKAGETMGLSHLRHLEKARAALGPNGASARLLLFAPAFAPELQRITSTRGDIELVDLERLYGGS
jgi:AAA+ ATPase superfamily predicted ATPase